ncbi:salivary peroxidase/catechol oxidase-like [Procambarus clarkii]|uniref:salivary peroxidase/catechol oxidase-like n=1 Tax=Procambarus clarkii TaxID=6728 RepID=UPI003742A78F
MMYGGNRSRVTGPQGEEDLQEVTLANTVIAATCPRHPRCDRHLLYRTLDGSCNNLEHPSWGQARTTYQRLRPPHYSDGECCPSSSPTLQCCPSSSPTLQCCPSSSPTLQCCPSSSPTLQCCPSSSPTLQCCPSSSPHTTNETHNDNIFPFRKLFFNIKINFCRDSAGLSGPRVSVGGGPLPSARLVSTSVAADEDRPSADLTLSVMQWGQFLDHDLAHTPINRFGDMGGIQCCGESGRHLVDAAVRHPACFPIEIPADDPFFGGTGRRCMNFVRSMLAPRADPCTLGHGEQMNQVTHYLDGSNIYGSSRQEEQTLRLFRGGLLVVQERDLLPPDSSVTECQSTSHGNSCFKAGDGRVNQQIELAIIHTVWVRMHNRIARELARLNPHWSDETIYQETRRIVVAIYQHIIYNEWLPLVLGKDYMAENGLLPLREGFSRGYDSGLNAALLNEFATVAFRFGHSLVQGMIDYDITVFYITGIHSGDVSSLREKDLKLVCIKDVCIMYVCVCGGRLVDATGAVQDAMPLYENFHNPGPVYTPGRLDDLLRGLATQPIQQLDNFVTSSLTNRLFQVCRRSWRLMTDDPTTHQNMRRRRRVGPSWTRHDIGPGRTETSAFLHLVRRLDHDMAQVMQPGIRLNPRGFLRLPLKQYPGVDTRPLPRSVVQDLYPPRRSLGEEFQQQLLMFQTREMPVGMDLVALNTQRARDHGVAPYNDLRAACGLTRAKTFQDLLDVLPPKVVNVFQQLYASVDDIDPFVAGISERPAPGALLGPTFRCIVGEQFIRLKRGDRFFYDLADMPASFSEAQLYSIRLMSWARVLCETGDMLGYVQPLAFRRPRGLNERVPCDSASIPGLDLSPWLSKT